MENLNKSIGSRISQLRRKQGLTQEKFAEEIDISIKHISAVERGTSSLSLEKLIEAGKHLDCTMDYLILGNEKRMAPTYCRHPSSLFCLLMMKKNCF